MRISWPTAVVLSVGMVVIGALVYTGHHMPAAIVGAAATAIAAALPQLIARLGSTS